MANCWYYDRMKELAQRIPMKVLLAATLIGLLLLSSCDRGEKTSAKDQAVAAEISVGVVKVGRKDLGRSLTQSSELVPFQEIDVYAKESGYIRDLNVDYGSHVTANQTLATLEIPELQAQLRQDDAAIKNASDQIGHAQNELSRVEAQHDALKAYFSRLDGVAKSKPGLVAQQEVEDAHAKDLAAEAQVEAAKTSVASAESLLAQAQAKREHDQVLFDYSKITAPFAGVVTQRFANLGALVQAGTSSSTQAMPIVRLSEDDKFRLVIPVPESYVHIIRIGDPVSVMVPSLHRTFPGTIARFAVDVREDTRTMHTEVDVLNPNRQLIAGMYAQATITVERKQNSIAVPIQAVSQQGDRAIVLVVTASNKIEIRPVSLGIQTATDAEILSGLQEGEMLVVSDRSGLKAGQDVRPKTVELLQYSEN
jgi:RND family efflux transporter MFP subunit